MSIVVVSTQWWMLMVLVVTLSYGNAITVMGCFAKFVACDSSAFPKVFRTLLTLTLLAGLEDQVGCQKPSVLVANALGISCYSHLLSSD